MARREKKEERDSSGDWLNTYADMITLVLCFFVLLYSSSSVDQQKWQYILQSFTSKGNITNPIVMEEVPLNLDKDYIAGQDATNQEINVDLPQNFDDLFAYLSKYIADEGLSDVVGMEQGKSYINIRFQNSVFFDGNSAVLKDGGRKMLSDMSPALRGLQKLIKSITVSGHTAVGISDINDWDLSSARASSVVKFLDYKQVVESKKFKTQGLAYYYPIASNDTEEGRAENRRVELTIVRDDVDMTDPEIIKDILSMDYNIGSDVIDPENPNPNRPEDSKFPVGSIDYIIDNMKNKFDKNPSLYVMPEDFVGPILQNDLENQQEEQDKQD